jgi:hypothetical protein
MSKMGMVVEEIIAIGSYERCIHGRKPEALEMAEMAKMFTNQKSNNYVNLTYIVNVVYSITEHFVAFI